MIQISDFTLTIDAPLEQALAKLEINCRGCILVLDENKVVGVITDGDIRRALLGGASLKSNIEVIMNRNFLSLPENFTIDEINAQFSDTIKFIPIVSETNEIISIEFRNEVISVPIASPNIGYSEKKYVNDCLDTTWISSKGSYVELFEAMFSELHDDRYALSVCNGTVALHLAMLSLGLGPGDEVIVPNLTFAATVNAVLYCGATPVLVDVDPLDWCMNCEEVERAITPRTKAVVSVNLFGQIVELDQFKVLTDEYKLKWIQDCAESIGSTYKDKHVGTFGDAATFSFFGNKTITTGEGGMICFKSQETFEKAKILRDHGMSPEKRYWHEVIGYNYRLTNLQAAIGSGQMERLSQIVCKKRQIAEWYRERLIGSRFVSQLPFDKPQSQNSYWVYPVKLNSKLNINDIMQFMGSHRIETRRIFYPMNSMPAYKELNAGPLKNSIEIFDNGICLPCYPDMTEEVVGAVSEKLIDACLTVESKYSVI